jgi:hypothetical protein
MNIKLTPAAKDLIIEALEQYIDGYKDAMGNSVFISDTDEFKSWGEKVLAAQTVLKQVRQ